MNEVSRDLQASLQEHEGFRSKAYLDSLGNLTIGYGQLVSELVVSKELAAQWLIAATEEKIKQLKTYECFNAVTDPVRRDVLIEMAYNLGVAGLMGFKNMWKSIKEKDWTSASKHMKDSRWATQVKSRADTLARRMETGRY